MLGRSFVQKKTHNVEHTYRHKTAWNCFLRHSGVCSFPVSENVRSVITKTYYLLMVQLQILNTKIYSSKIRQFSSLRCCQFQPIQSKVRVTDELMGKDLEGISHDLIDVMCPNFPWWTEGSQDNCIYSSRWLGQDITQGPSLLEYYSRILPLLSFAN
jgi:hypothetical protein